MNDKGMLRGSTHTYTLLPSQTLISATIFYPTLHNLMLNRELGLISHLPFSQPVVNIPWNDTKTFKKSNLFHFILNIIVFPMPSALMSQQKEKKNLLHKAGFIYKGSHTLLTARSNITTAFWNNFRYIIGKIIHSPYPQVCASILCFYAS